jgi:hypothetical protein
LKSENSETPLHVIYFILCLSNCPWTRILLEKLMVAQLIKKFPAFYATSRFLTRAPPPPTGPFPEFNPHHLTLFLLKSILILSSHLGLGLPSGSKFHKKYKF